MRARFSTLASAAGAALLLLATSCNRTASVSPPPAPQVAADREGACAALERGERLFDATDYAGARTAFADAVAKDPSCAAAEFALGRSFVVTSAGMSYSRAIDHFERALALDPKLVQAHWGLGLARAGLARPEEARRDLELFLASDDPRSPPQMLAEAHHFLGVILRDARDDAAALRHFERARALARDASSPCYETALTYEQMGEREQAVHWLEETIHLEPSHLAAHFRLARLYDELGRAADAERQRAIHKLLNDLTDDLTGRSTREPARRAEIYGSLARLDPSNVAAQIGYAQALDELGRRSEAELVLNALVQEHPRLDPALVPAKLRPLLRSR